MNFLLFFKFGGYKMFDLILISLRVVFLLFFFFVIVGAIVCFFCYIKNKKKLCAVIALLLTIISVSFGVLGFGSVRVSAKINELTIPLAIESICRDGNDGKMSQFETETIYGTVLINELPKDNSKSNNIFNDELYGSKGSIEGIDYWAGDLICHHDEWYTLGVPVCSIGTVYLVNDSYKITIDYAYKNPYKYLYAVTSKEFFYREKVDFIDICNNLEWLETGEEPDIWYSTR